MKVKFLVLLLLVVAPLYAGELFRDDFSYYPSGWLSHPLDVPNEAIEQYHYIASRRGVPSGPWANAIWHLDAWLVGDEDGKPYLEQQLDNRGKRIGQSPIMNPILIVGDPEWSDYTVEAKVKPLSLADMAGVVFRYHTNRHYYLFALTGGNKARLALRLPLEKTLRVAEWRELASKDFTYDVKRYYLLRVENDGPRIRAYVDGKLVLEAADTEILKGKAGLTANIPARFQDFGVRTADATEREIGWIRVAEAPMIDATADEHGITISTTGTLRLRIHAKDMAPGQLSQSLWDLPGLRVAVTADTQSIFSLERTDPARADPIQSGDADAVDLGYEGITSMRLEIKADAD